MSIHGSERTTPHSQVTETRADADTAPHVEPAASSRAAIIPSIYRPSPPIEEQLDHFFDMGPTMNDVVTDVSPPDQPLKLLEELGPSPFERGSFPLVGFLATTYDKVTRYATERD